MALVYRGSPLLLTDPRSQLEISFVLARGLMLVVALVLAGILVLARRAVIAERSRPPGRALLRPLLTFALLWAGVGGLYVGLGTPGIYQDGFVIVLKEQADLSGAPAIADRVEPQVTHGSPVSA